VRALRQRAAEQQTAEQAAGDASGNASIVGVGRGDRRSDGKGNQNRQGGKCQLFHRKPHRERRVSPSWASGDPLILVRYYLNQIYGR
jgi:hypothetical protein